MTNSRVDVVLLTVTDVEVQTILDLAEKRSGSECKTPHFSERIAYYDLGNIGNAHTLMVRSEMGSTDPDGSLATVQECINLFDPDVVISVGIAFGIDETKQKIGQVLVSKQLHAYDLQRVGQDEYRTIVEVANELIGHALYDHQLAASSLQTWQQLTQREREITALIWLGLTNPQIAERLLISPNTVKTHVKNILNKFNVHSKKSLSKLLAGLDLSDWANLGSDDDHPPTPA